MKREEFLDRVKNKAHQRVNAKLKAFKERIHCAVRELDDKLDDEERLGVVRNAVLDYTGYAHNYPRALWANEQMRVENEVLATMDLVQQLLVVAPPSPNDEKPAPEAVKGEKQ